MRNVSGFFGHQMLKLSQRVNMAVANVNYIGHMVVKQEIAVQWIRRRVQQQIVFDVIRTGRGQPATEIYDDLSHDR